jgi:uncharacterized membrane protein YdjX (TVP38/TMEM64 family)
VNTERLPKDSRSIGAAPSAAADRRLWPTVAAVLVVGGWAFWSYRSNGIVAALFTAATDAERSLAVLRGYLERAGPLAPLVYVVAVVLEVVIAPLPGTLLYAPGGAIFGGLAGGTLSLAGNVIGAMVATYLASVFGHRLTATLEHSRLQHYAERVRDNSVAVIALLRVNPFTSSDIVSYAAGLVGISPWRVGLGTFIGMAPLCYVQAYAAEKIFRILPASGLILLALGVIYVAIVLVLLLKYLRPRTHDKGTPSDVP